MRLLLVAVLCGVSFAYYVPEPTQIVDIDIPGNYFWFPSPLPNECCAVKFQLKATRDAVITFSPRKSLILTVYQAIIGAERNQNVCLVKDLGTRPIVDERWNGILTDTWQTFLVEYCNGQISVKGDVGGQTQDLATYTDNNPYTDNEWYVGVTSLHAKSEWKFVSSESCGITDQTSPEPSNQPEEDNKEPAEDNDVDDDGDEQNAGSDVQSDSSRSGTSREGEGETSDGDGDEQNAGSDGQNGSSRSGTSQEGERESSDGDGDEQNAGSDGQNGSSSSGTSQEGERESSDGDGDEQNAGSGGQNGSSRSGTSQEGERESSDGDGDEQNAGSDSQRESSGSGSSSSDETAPDGDNQGSNSEKFQIDISGGQNVYWKFIDQEIASPYNFRIPFWLQAERDCYIRLASRKDEEAGEYYDIMIGFLENQFVCMFREGIQVRDVFKENLLNDRAFVDFVLSFDGRTVQLEKGGEILASYPDDNIFKSIKYIGITSHADGKTIDSSWRFNKNSFIFSEQYGGENENSSDSKSSTKSSSSSRSGSSS